MHSCSWYLPIIKKAWKLCLQHPGAILRVLGKSEVLHEAAAKSMSRTSNAPSHIQNLTSKFDAVNHISNSLQCELQCIIASQHKLIAHDIPYITIESLLTPRCLAPSHKNCLQQLLLEQTFYMQCLPQLLHQQTLHVRCLHKLLLQQNLLHFELMSPLLPTPSISPSHRKEGIA